jgi:hypothetical protein
VRDAVSLDMGEWRLPGFDAAAADGGGVDGASGLLPTLREPGAGGAAPPRRAPLRVYQVLAPALCARAHVFGNRMALKPGAACLDLPYFDAPGAGAADAGGSEASKGLGGASTENARCGRPPEPPPPTCPSPARSSP